MDSPKYPMISIPANDIAASSFTAVSRVIAEMQRLGVDPKEIRQFNIEALDVKQKNELVQAFSKWVTVI